MPVATLWRGAGSSETRVRRATAVHTCRPMAHRPSRRSLGRNAARSSQRGERLLRDLLANASGLDGTEEAPENRPAVPDRELSTGDRPYERAPRRDERFPDPYNMSVHAEAFR